MICVYFTIGAIGLLLLLVAYYYGVFKPKQDRRARQREIEVLTEGHELLGYIVYANDSLYERSDSDSYSYAQIVYVLDEDVEDREETLEAMAEKLRNFKVKDESDRTERMIRQVLGTSIPLFEALKLPKRVSGGLDAYTASIDIYWSHFKKRKLVGPFIKVRQLDTKSSPVVVPELGSDYDKEIRADMNPRPSRRTEED